MPRAVVIPLCDLAGPAAHGASMVADSAFAFPGEVYDAPLRDFYCAISETRASTRR